MNKELQRIKIAKACGWHSFQLPTEAMPHLLAMKGPIRGFMPVPHYLSDLNAMARAELRLASPELQNRYQAEILEITYNDYERRYNQGIFNQLTATAEQRAEAFLRTLNLWTPTGEENE